MLKFEGHIQVVGSGMLAEEMDDHCDLTSEFLTPELWFCGNRNRLPSC